MTPPWDIGVDQFVPSSSGIHVRGRRLVIRAAWNPLVITVLQDGDEAYVGATHQYDDAFSAGIDDGSALSVQPRVSLGTLDVGYAGASLSFSVIDLLWRNSLNIGLNDIVELWVERGGELATSAASLPSWHHLNQPDGERVCVFRGRIVSREPTQAEGAPTIEVNCEDMRAIANKIPIVRDLPNGVTVPHLIFNAPDQDADWLVSVKKKADGSFATGNLGSLLLGDRMSVYDGLRYLQAVHADELTARRVKNAGADLFDDDEISLLTSEMPRIDFVSVGFTDAIEKILALVPDHALHVDPKTNIWHVRKVRFDIVHGQSTTLSSGVSGGVSTLPVTNDALFSSDPADTGHRVLVTNPDNPQQAQRFEVTAVGTGTIDVTPATQWAFPSGATVVPLYADADRLPELVVDIGADAEAMQLSESLERTFSAVRITSAQQKVEEFERQLIGDSDTISSVMRAYDNRFEEKWEAKHGDREADWGADGHGIEVYSHTLFMSKSEIRFRATSSQHDLDHDIVSGGVSEWDGTALQFILHEGAHLTDRAIPVASRITQFVFASDVDGMGNPGYVVRVAHDITAHAEGLTPIYTIASPGPMGEVDRVILTQDLDLRDLDGAPAVGQLNRRWMTYRAYISTDSEVIVERNNQTKCQTPAQAYGGRGQGQRTSNTFDPLTSGAPRTRQELEDFWAPILGPSAVTGWTPRAWFLTKPEPNNTDAEACARAEALGERPQVNQARFKVRKISNEVHQVRVPSNGYSGIAKLFHGLEEELILQVGEFTAQAQAYKWQAIAEAIWRDVSTPLYRGNLPLPNVQPWLGLCDLGVMIRLRTQNVNAGAVNEISRFGAPVARVRFDFSENRTELEFSNRGVLADIDAELLDSVFVDDAAARKKTEDELKSTQMALACLQRPSNTSPTPVRSCDIVYPNQSGGGKGGRPGGPPPIPPKEEELGLSEIAPSLARALGGSRNHGFVADGVLEEDALGQAFFSGNGQGLLPGTVSGDEFTPDATSTKRITGRASQTQQDFARLLMTLFGIDLDYRRPLIHGMTDSGATATIIPIAHPGMIADEFAGGTLHVLDGRVRPAYSIVSNTATELTLSSGMMEPLPPSGVLVVVRPQYKPKPAEADFSSGGTGIKDSDGNWHVATGAAMVPADLVGSELEEDTSSPPPFKFRLGTSNSEIEALGVIDLSGATVIYPHDHEGYKRRTGRTIYHQSDDFDAPNSENGEYGWNGMTVSTNGTPTVGSVAEEVEDHPGVLEIIISATNNDYAALNTGSSVGHFKPKSGVTQTLRIWAKTKSTTQFTIIIGLVSSVSSDTPGRGIYFLGRGGTNWVCRTKDSAGTPTETDLGVAVGTGWCEFEIVINGTTSVDFRLRTGGTDYTAQHTTNIPTDTALIRDMMVRNTGTATKSLYVDAFDHLIEGLSRA